MVISRVYKDFCMSKLLIATLLLSFSTLSFATDADTITFVHGKTKSTMIEECKKVVPGATDNVCTCVGEKAQSSLDDNALKQCPDGDGFQSCIEKIVTDAAKIGFSDETLKNCGYKKS